MKKRRGTRQKAPSAKDFLTWELRFLNCASGENGAARALRRLEQAALGSACKRLLWEYSEGHTYFARIQEGVALIVTNIRAFDRAERVWKSKLDDPRAALFRQRFETAARALMETPWPFRNPAIKTFGELFRLTRSADLFNLRKIGGLVGRSKLSFLLVMLQAGAEAHGVNLSANELASLAYCASGEELEGRAVRRILRESWIDAAKPGYGVAFENSYCRACVSSST